MITDAIIIISVFFCLWRGACRGFLKSIFAPIAFIIATTVAFSLFKITGNIFIGLGVGLLGPMCIYWFLVFILRSFGQLVGEENQPNLISRLSGAGITAAWGLVLTLPLVLVLSFMPNVHPIVSRVTTDIKNSQVYNMIKPLKDLFSQPAKNIPPKNASGGTMVVGPSTQKSSAATASTGDPIQDLVHDMRMQDLINDPVIKKAIEEKNYATLLASPLILEMAQDPQFIKKLMAAYAEMQKNGTLPQVPAELNKDK